MKPQEQMQMTVYQNLKEMLALALQLNRPAEAIKREAGRA